MLKAHRDPSAYYLPLYFQILGSSAIGAGVRMLPFSLGSALVSATSGVIVSRTKEYRIVMWLGWTIFVLGFGLMTTLDSFSSTAKKEVFPLIAAIGFGCQFQTPLIALQAAMPIKDMATSTAAFGFIRTLGGKFHGGTLLFPSYLLPFHRHYRYLHWTSRLFEHPYSSSREDPEFDT